MAVDNGVVGIGGISMENGRGEKPASDEERFLVGVSGSTCGTSGGWWLSMGVGAEVGIVDGRSFLRSLLRALRSFSAADFADLSTSSACATID